MACIEAIFCKKIILKIFKNFRKILVKNSPQFFFNFFFLILASMRILIPRGIGRPNDLYFKNKDL